MNLIIVTHDLMNEKQHLMPWRVLVEVTYHLRRTGHDVTLVSLGNSPSKGKERADGIARVRKSYDHLAGDLADIIQKKNPDLIYWPLSWREPHRRTRIIASFGTPIIGYFPGGFYSLASVCRALKRLGLRASFPYLLEALAPKSKQIAFLRSHGFKYMVAITDLTSRWITKAGWPEDRIAVIPPGKAETKAEDTGGLQDTIKDWLAGRPFYLFMGPPGKIRGVYELLRAFEKTANNLKDVCLVCLFRGEEGRDTKGIRDFLSKLEHRDRIYTVWKSLDKRVLGSFMKACHAQILPFILVPSEIPLAIIEAMAFGKPVITTRSGGTGEFVQHFGIAVPTGDVDSLVQAMTSLVENVGLYQEKCRLAVNGYRSHPSWQDVSHQWLRVAEAVVGK